MFVAWEKRPSPQLPFRNTQSAARSPLSLPFLDNNPSSFSPPPKPSAPSPTAPPALRPLTSLGGTAGGRRGAGSVTGSSRGTARPPLGPLRSCRAVYGRDQRNGSRPAPRRPPARPAPEGRAALCGCGGAGLCCVESGAPDCGNAECVELPHERHPAQPPQRLCLSAP